MSYSRIPLRPRDRRSRTVPAVLTVLTVLLLIGAVLLWRDAASALLWRVAAPVVALRDTFGATQAAQLRGELASTTAALADRDELLQENEQLKAMLGRTPASVATTLAAVLEHPPAADYDTLIIDIGSDYGIAVGDKVAAGGTTLVGTISQVDAHTSVVTLYSAPGGTYQATLSSATTSSSLPVSVAGQGGGSFVGQVPSGTQVAVGDSVTFPDLGGDLIAQVSAVDAPAGSSFITIYMHLPVNLFDLRYVQVWHTQ